MHKARCIRKQTTNTRFFYLPFRVKLPKSFIAVNLSDAFTFEEQDDAEDEPEHVNGVTKKPEDDEPKAGSPEQAIEQQNQSQQTHDNADNGTKQEEASPANAAPQAAQQVGN